MSRDVENDDEEIDTEHEKRKRRVRTKSKFPQNAFNKMFELLSPLLFT